MVLYENIVNHKIIDLLGIYNICINVVLYEEVMSFLNYVALASG